MSYMGNCKTSSQSAGPPIQGGVQVVVCQEPVVQVEQEEGQGVHDDGDGVQHSGLLYQHLQSNLQAVLALVFIHHFLNIKFMYLCLFLQVVTL